MVIRLKLRGEGTDRSPHNGGVPTGQEILTLPDQGVTYWYVPDETHPNLHEHASAKVERSGHGPLLTALDEAGHAEWHKFLDNRYKEHKGKFRPEVAS